jgi:ABC-type protease/lipase transport system fused ATPase/permease subunit
VNNAKPQFPFSTNAYLGVIASSIILFPIELEAIRSKATLITPSNWYVAIFIVLITVVLLFYANIRCSSEKLSYIQGLQFVTSFMRGAGLMYITMFLIFLSLCIVFPASFAISIYGDLTRKNNLTPIRYHKLVLLFHKHRARQ